MHDELIKSPLFNLSMASKELFHSNLLYWLAVAYHDQFKEIMRKLDVKVEYWPNKWKCHREKFHFDLLITDEKEERYYLVLENKVKSIPYTEQLDEYTKKVEKQSPCRLLLSLATKLPNSEFIEKSGWIIKNYQELALAIFSVLPSIPDVYHRLLLEDYSMCILSLHEKQLQWNYDKNISYIKQFVNASNNEEPLRIEDMRKKVLYSRLAAELQNKLGAKLFTNKQIVNENTKDGPGSVYVNYGMTRSMGLVDVKVRIKDNFLFVIQLQGPAYKHCVETLDKEGLGYVKDLGLILENGNTSTKTNTAICDIANNFFFTSDEKPNISVYDIKDQGASFPNTYESKDGKKKSAYNKYGESFIYQYVKLTNEVTVNDIITAIDNEVKKVKEITNKL